MSNSIFRTRTLSRAFYLICLTLSISLASCSETDDPTPDEEPTAVADSVLARNKSIEALLADNVTTAIAGAAYNVAYTTASIPVRFNASAERLPSAELVLLLTDNPNKKLEFGKGCKEVYINSDWLDENGMAIIYVTGLTHATSYRYRVHYRYNDKDRALSDILTLETPEQIILTAEAVDLGLSVKWASWNLGASRSYHPGRYYSYGLPDSWNAETPGTSPSSDIADTENDPAYVELGGNWRSPSVKQCQELMQNCRWVESVEGGVRGYRVSGRGDYSGNYIFIPKTGYYNANGVLTSDGEALKLWTGQAESASKAWSLNCANGNEPTVGRTGMDCMMPIRPVCVE